MAPVASKQHPRARSRWPLLALPALLAGCPESTEPTDAGPGDAGDGGPPLSARWTVVRTPQPGQPNLFGLWGEAQAPGRFIAVGSGGAIVQAEPDPDAAPLADGRPALRLTPLPSGVTTDLTYVHGSAANDVYAVGLGGTILRYDGSAWTAETPKKAKPEDPPFTADLWGVFAYPGGAIAVGRGGVWVKRVMGAWQPPQKLAVEGLLHIWGTAADNIYAVGSVGYIFRYKGTGNTWDVVSPAGFTNKLAGIFGAAANNVYAVGLTGSVLRGSGGAFVDIGAKFDVRCGTGVLPKVFYRNGVVTPSGQVVLIGWEGTIVRLLDRPCGDLGTVATVLTESGATDHRLEGILQQGSGADTSIYISGAEGVLLRGRQEP